MKLNRNKQRLISLQQLLFYILLAAAVILLAQLAERTNTGFDLTINQRHSLSQTTLDLLDTLQQPVSIDVFISNSHQYRPAIQALLTRYQAASPQLNIRFIDPEQAPQQVRELNIRQQGEMVITLGQQRQHVLDLSEQSLTNALISVSRDRKPLVVFIEGHGERSPFSEANFGLSLWAEHLQATGIQVQSLNLAQTPFIPDTTRAVVIASPQHQWLDGEIRLIRDYIDAGGNLLWLAEPHQHLILAEIAEYLGLYFNSGTVIDPNALVLGIEDPRFVVITDYANHPVTAATPSVTLFPEAVAIEQNPAFNTDWHYTSLLHTANNSWSTLAFPGEDGLLPDFNEASDIAGPLSIGFLLHRSPETSDQPQRVAVIGDGDFVSNSYLGNAANLDFAGALMNWLTDDDQLIAIPLRNTRDNQLQLSERQSMAIGIGFLFVLPLLLLLSGLLIWWRRRKR